MSDLLSKLNALTDANALTVALDSELERIKEKSDDFATARNEMLDSFPAALAATHYESPPSTDEVTQLERARLEQLNLPYDELLSLAASNGAWMDFFEFAYENSSKQYEALEKLVHMQSQLIDELEFRYNVIHDAGELQLTLKSLGAAFDEKLTRYKVTKRARNAVNIRHSKPDGSRAKAQAIRDIWATGKYTSRDICAEQECANLNISFSTARKALRNTPEPT
jgi:hypothetical protein